MDLFTEPPPGFDIRQMPVVAKIRPLKDQPNLVVGDFSANQGILWLIKSTDSKTDRVMLRQLDEDAAAAKKNFLLQKKGT